jgi:Condensation domain
VISLHTINDWEPDAGSVVSWQPSPEARVKAAHAPISAVPASYQQARHLRRYREQAARGLDMARLNIGCCDLPGQCDIPALTNAINAHLRRHDVYHSWFEPTDTEQLVRHTIADPAGIEFVPTAHGDMTAARLRDHLLATPDPLQWDCFRFGIIQRADHFTLYGCVDHLNTDGVSVGAIFLEIYMTYTTLADTGVHLALPDPGSYDDYSARQHQYAAALTVDSPPVRAWIRFAENNDKTLPGFALPLGDPSLPCNGGLMTVRLMDEQETHQFESACIEAGVRFSGGVFGCAALTEHELTGAETYYGITPYNTRSTPADNMTVGWFAGLVPITVHVAATSFGEAARAAQESFDSNKELANVPFERLLELAPWLRMPTRGFSMVSYLDFNQMPMTDQWEALNFGVYSDGRHSPQVVTWVNRLRTETTLTVLFPNNSVARESVYRYTVAMKSVYARFTAHHSAVRTVAKA